MMIKHGANPNLKNKSMKTPLMLAIDEKKKEAIKGMLKIYRMCSKRN